MAAAAALQKRLQPPPDAAVLVQINLAHEICRSHDADNAPGAVDDRQGLDVPLAHEAPGFVQMRAKLHRQRIGRHDVGAAQLTQIALIRRQLCVVQQGCQIIPADIQNLVVARQSHIQISRAESAGFCGCGHRRALGMRVAATCQIVVEHASHHQQRGVEQHGIQRKLVAGHMQYDRQQGRCAARWVQTPKKEHQSHRAANTHRRSQGGVGDGIGAKNPGQRRNGVAAQHSPRLRHGAGRQGKHNHGAGTHGGHQPGDRGAAAVEPTARHRRHHNAKGHT